MTYIPCHEVHASREEALECVRRAAAERAAHRSPEWQDHYDKLRRMMTAEPFTVEPAEPPEPEPWPLEQRAQFVEALAVDEGFRGAIRAWIGGAA